MDTVPDLHIAVFAKPFVPGEVKTRLIPSVGAEGAARLQAAMLWHTLSVAHEVAGERVSLWIAGDPDHATLQPFRAAFAPSLHRQQGHDLGARMRTAMAASLQHSARVLLIGCDCPVLSAASLRDAAAAMDDGGRDAVFIPVEDGGYVLVGLNARPGHQRAVLDAMFRRMAWSTERVMTQTRAQLTAAGISWAEQPMLWDIDRPADLRRAQRLGLLGEHRQNDSR